MTYAKIFALLSLPTSSLQQLTCLVIYFNFLNIVGNTERLKKTAAIIETHIKIEIYTCIFKGEKSIEDTPTARPNAFAIIGLEVYL
jgi:hypothetical protein